MSHLMFISGGAAYDFLSSIAPASVSSASLGAANNVSVYAEEFTTDTFTPSAPLHHGVVKTPPSRAIQKSRGACLYCQAGRRTPTFFPQHFTPKIAWN